MSYAAAKNLHKLTEEEYYAYIEDHGHILKRREDGSVDYFAMEYEYHNGPACVRAGCYDMWCHHCRDEVKPCEAAGPELFPLTRDDAKLPEPD